MEEIIDEYGRSICVLIGAAAGFMMFAKCFYAYRESIVTMLTAVMFR